MCLEAAKAVLLMVEHKMVLKRADREEGLDLVWWSGRCSCFHCLKDGKFGGIYTGGIFHNLMPFFKYRPELGDKELLYCSRPPCAERDKDEDAFQLMRELKRRSGMEVLYANNAQVACNALFSAWFELNKEDTV